MFLHVEDNAFFCRELTLQLRQFQPGFDLLIWKYFRILPLQLRIYLHKLLNILILFTHLIPESITILLVTIPHTKLIIQQNILLF